MSTTFSLFRAFMYKIQIVWNRQKGCEWADGTYDVEAAQKRETTKLLCNFYVVIMNYS